MTTTVPGSLNGLGASGMSREVGGVCPDISATLEHDYGRAGQQYGFERKGYNGLIDLIGDGI